MSAACSDTARVGSGLTDLEVVVVESAMKRTLCVFCVHGNKASLLIMLRKRFALSCLICSAYGSIPRRA